MSTSTEKRMQQVDHYPLGRTMLASSRLALQHFLWRESLGYNLHPSIPVPTSPIKVAEVATGTSIWLNDLAPLLHPSSELDGYDISDNQFPAPIWQKSNVSARVLDASREPPEHLCGKYDIVHLRLFTLVVENNDPEMYIRHCLSLLKPGGYLQWDEYDSSSTGVVRAPNVDASSLLTMLMGMKATRPLGWIKALSQHFHHAGLDVMSCTRVAPPAYLLPVFSQMLSVVQTEIAESLEASGQQAAAQNVRQLNEKAAQEIRNGASFKHSLQVTVARKPELRREIVWEGPRDTDVVSKL